MARFKEKAGHGRPHIGVRIDRQDKELLKVIAARKGISLSDLLRPIIDRAILEFLKNPQ